MNAFCRCGRTARNLASFVAIALVLCLCSRVPAANEARPNVIVVMTDDQGYGDLSCHGNPVVKTPNLDDLGRHSIRLTDFHVAPMCTPTRGQLMTGQDALRNRAMNVSSGRTLLKRDLPTMANFFADAGYRTAIFGKWHLGDNYPYRPQDRGFQECLWFPSSHIGSLPDYWNNDYFHDTYFHQDGREQIDGYCTDVFFDRAKHWILSADAAKQPFFLYLPLNAPHGPHYVPAKYRPPVAARLAAAADKLPELEKARQMQLVRFLAMIENIDENVGKLMQFLDEHKLVDNTIVIYMTDNGSTMGPSYYNAGMRGGKTTLWEGGHRVPCFIRWPQGDLGQPREIDELTQVQDVLPTLIDFCGLDRKNAKFDGQSLADLLRGRTKELADRMLVIDYSRMPSADNEQTPVSIPTKKGAAVLWKKWRLIAGEQLYDLTADPEEQKDVHSEHPDVAKKMRAHLDKWWAGLGPDVDGYESVVIGNKAENPTRLSACEWLDVFADQQFQVRAGVRRKGTWHLDVERPGTYKFELRRWPEESGLPIDAPAEATAVTDGKLPAGKALPIKTARLQVGDRTQDLRIRPEDKFARFQAELKTGPIELTTTFLDADGEEICGAYYVTVTAPK